MSIQHNEWKMTHIKEHHGAMSGYQIEEKIPRIFREEKVTHKVSGIRMEFNSSTKHRELEG